MKHTSLKIKIPIFIFIGFYIIFGLLITVYQEKIIYQPSKADFNNCPNLEEAQKISIQGTHAYYYHSPESKKLIVLYHGNGGSACDRAFWTSFMQKGDYSYLIPEYYGYSNDASDPNHDNIKQDIEYIVQFIKDGSFESVTVVGESIGSGMASYHTSLLQPQRILLLSPFTNLVNIAQQKFSLYPVSLLVDNAFDNEQLLKGYENDITIIHGTNDKVIDFSLGKKLFDSLESKNKTFIMINGAGHNDLLNYPEALDAVSNFF